jgi:hypothetical protein
METGIVPERASHSLVLRNVKHQVLANDLTGRNGDFDRSAHETSGKYSRDRVRSGRHIHVQQLSRTERHVVGEDRSDRVRDGDRPRARFSDEVLADWHGAIDEGATFDEEPGDQFRRSGLDDRLTGRWPNRSRTRTEWVHRNAHHFGYQPGTNALRVDRLNLRHSNRGTGET